MNETSSSYVLENGLISRFVEISGADAANTKSIKNLQTDREFLAPGQCAREFAVRWRGHWLHGAPAEGQAPDFLFVRATERAEEEGVRRLDLFLTARDGDLQAQVTYLIYAGLPLIRKSVAFSNEGQAPGAVTGLVWEDLPICPGAPGEFEIFATPEAANFGSCWHGRPGEAIAMCVNWAAGEAYVVVNEAAGPAGLIDINGGWTPRLRVMRTPTPGGHVLEPGQSLESPSSSLLLLTGLTPNCGTPWELREYARRVLANQRTAGPPLVYSMKPSPGAMTPENGESKIQSAAGAGFLVVSVDGGGMRHPGGFEVDTETLPGGLGPISRRLEELDIGLGVSLSLAALDADAPVVLEHPDWLCLDEQGKPLRLGAAGDPRVMVCLASDYRRWLVEQTVKLCAEHRVGYLHFTGPAALFGPDRGSPCAGSFHHHAGAGDAGRAISEGLLELAREIEKQNPDLIVGFDHNLWGSDHGADFSILRACDFLRICDIPDKRGNLAPLEARRLLYRRARLYPAECLYAGSLRIDGPNPVASMATALAGFPVLHGEANRLTSGQVDWLRLILTWRRSLARSIDFHERFFLLRPDRAPRKGLWDGYANLSREGQGYAGVFRNFAPNEAERFFIPGLCPSASYRLESVFRDRSLGIFKGDALEAEGLSIVVPMEDGADLIEIRRVEE